MSGETENTQDGYWEGLVKHEQQEILSELDLKIVHKNLEYAREYSLESEVVWSAIKFAQAHPKAKILEVMNAACVEWDVSP